MRKLMVLGVLAAVAVLTTMVTLLPLAGGGPAQADDAAKATGEVGYTAVGLQRYADFNAHESYYGRPDKGEFHYSDVSGQWYDVDVQCVKAIGDKVYFAGPVVSASNPSWLTNWLSAAVQDGGTPGSDGDQIWGIFANKTTALNNCNNGFAPGPAFAITSGNLVVHN